MALYQYKAVTRQGEVKTGSLSAQSQQDAITRIQAMDLIPLSADPVQEAAKAGVQLGSYLQKRRLGSKDIGQLTRQLSILIDAGLPLDRSLDIIHKVSSHEQLVSVVQNLQTQIRGGNTLSKALSLYPAHFSNFYISFVNAAEISGNMAQSLEDLAVYLEKARALKDKLLSAMIYPLILIAVTILSLLVIVLFVLPEFSRLFEDMNAELPASTAFVLAAADSVRAYGLYVLALLGVVALYFRQRRQDPRWKLDWDRRMLGMALIGDLTKKIEIARLSRSLGTLLRGGVPILQALTIAKDVVANSALVSRLESATSSLQDGSSLAKPLLVSGDFPEFALQMIQVGEETGELDKMLIRVADIYDEEVGVTTQRLLTILEPLTIVTLGLVIGGIIMSILVAILSINELPI